MFDLPWFNDCGSKTPQPTHELYRKKNVWPENLMAPIPHDGKYDNTLALLSEGYNFIGNRCRRHGSDAFATRLMLKPVICTMGEDAARMFYRPDRFSREGAMPATTLLSLQDRGSVQLTQSATHAQRKQLFMGIMTPESIGSLAVRLREEWRKRLPTWEDQGRVMLHTEFREILCRATCHWAGVPLDDAQVSRRARELGAMIEGAGAVGPRNWRGLLLRTRTERWAQQLIEDVRTHKLKLAPTTALYLIAWYREDGELLDKKTAGIELLNLLRPTVAVSRYFVFAALALHDHPDCRERLQSEDDRYLQYFVQELRRFYPFFPFVGGRVREAFEWHDHHFDEGSWVLLDLYGTNHDQRLWQEPGHFNPERFRDWNGSAYNFIPQGGGDFASGHRCAGEWITIELMKTGSRLLANEMQYQVPAQDLSIDMARIPAMPSSGFVIDQVQRLSERPPLHHTATICPFPERKRARS